MGLGGVTDALRRMVRAALDLPVKPGTPPSIMHLGLYRARVDACASDGSTVDVKPDDSRISAEKGVKLDVGIPGAVATVQPGCYVHLGWRGGDPGQPYCIPCWDTGATTIKLVLKAQTVYLGDEAGAEALCRKSDFDNHTHAFGSIACSTGVVSGATAGAAGITGTAQVRGK